MTIDSSIIALLIKIVRIVQKMVEQIRIVTNLEMIPIATIDSIR